jgi:hypothetical protein
MDIYEATKDAVRRDLNAEQRRAAAVAIALELINSRCRTAEHPNLEGYLGSLDEFADTIQVALRVE